MAKDPRLLDDRFEAVVSFIGNTGADEFQIRYSDDQLPVVWIALASYTGVRVKHATNYDEKLMGHLKGHKLGVGTNPLAAVLDLARDVARGGTCSHCGRTTGISDDWKHKQPLDEVICWYVFDPDTKSFRRSCEAERP